MRSCALPVRAVIAFCFLASWRIRRRSVLPRRTIARHALPCSARLRETRGNGVCAEVFPGGQRAVQITVRPFSAAGVLAGTSFEAQIGRHDPLLSAVFAGSKIEAAVRGECSPQEGSPPRPPERQNAVRNAVDQSSCGCPHVSDYLAGCHRSFAAGVDRHLNVSESHGTRISRRLPVRRQHIPAWGVS